MLIIVIHFTGREFFAYREFEKLGYFLKSNSRYFFRGTTIPGGQGAATCRAFKTTLRHNTVGRTSLAE